MKRRKLRFLVEGKDDEHVVGQLTLAHQVLGPDDLDFNRRPRDEGGFEWLMGVLPAELESSLDQTLIIVVDADDDPESRLRSVCQVVANRGGQLTAFLDGEGALGTAPNGQALGLWLMPDHRSPGMLENLFSSLDFVNADDLWPHAQRVVAELPRKQFGREIKASVHTWLAWQRNPGLPMGVSIKANPGNAASPAVDAFIRFLRRCTNLDA